MLDLIIEAHRNKSDRELLHQILLNQYLITQKLEKIMGLTDDMSAQLDRIEAAQTDAKAQNDTIASEIQTLISEIGTTPGISAADAASLIARATTIADASEAVDAALKGTATAGANTPAPAPTV